MSTEQSKVEHVHFSGATGTYKKFEIAGKKFCLLIDNDHENEPPCTFVRVCRTVEECLDDKMHPDHPTVVFVHHVGDAFVNMIAVECEGTEIVLGMNTRDSVMRISDNEEAVKADCYLNDIPCFTVNMPKIT